MRILYIEDNAANVFLIQRVARMGGYEVVTYVNGEDALDNFGVDNPDLILVDLQLAGELHGLDVVKKLRSDGHELPIIAVTAYAMVGDREKCLDAGCDAYMPKPLPVSELVDVLKRYETRASVKKTMTQEAEPTPKATKNPDNDQNNGSSTN
jgi:CheY-like chemotaxis protein